MVKKQLCSTAGSTQGPAAVRGVELLRSGGSEPGFLGLLVAETSFDKDTTYQGGGTRI